MKKTERLISPLLKLGMAELAGRLSDVEDLVEPAVMSNALVSNADTDLQRLRESYSLLLAADTLWKGQLSEIYKEDLLIHVALLRVAEFLLAMDMEDISEQLQGGKEVLTGWLRHKTEQTPGGEAETVARYGMQLIDKIEQK